MTIGTYDGAGVFELVGNKTRTTKRILEQAKKSIQKKCKEQGLDIIIQCNMKIMNYLDVTFNFMTE